LSPLASLAFNVPVTTPVVAFGALSTTLLITGGVFVAAEAGTTLVTLGKTVRGLVLRNVNTVAAGLGTC